VYKVVQQVPDFCFGPKNISNTLVENLAAAVGLYTREIFLQTKNNSRSHARLCAAAVLLLPAE